MHPPTPKKEAMDLQEEQFGCLFLVSFSFVFFLLFGGRGVGDGKEPNSAICFAPLHDHTQA